MYIQNELHYSKVYSKQQCCTMNSPSIAPTITSAISTFFESLAPTSAGVGLLESGSSEAEGKPATPPTPAPRLMGATAGGRSASNATSAKRSNEPPPPADASRYTPPPRSEWPATLTLERFALLRRELRVSDSPHSAAAAAAPYTRPPPSTHFYRTRYAYATDTKGSMAWKRPHTAIRSPNVLLLVFFLVYIFIIECFQLMVCNKEHLSQHNSTPRASLKNYHKSSH